MVSKLDRLLDSIRPERTIDVAVSALIVPGRNTDTGVGAKRSNDTGVSSLGYPFGCSRGCIDGFTGLPIADYPFYDTPALTVTVG